jgi:hypothetical protein
MDYLEESEKSDAGGEPRDTTRLADVFSYSVALNRRSATKSETNSLCSCLVEKAQTNSANQEKLGCIGVKAGNCQAAEVDSRRNKETVIIA